MSPKKRRHHGVGDYMLHGNDDIVNPHRLVLLLNMAVTIFLRRCVGSAPSGHGLAAAITSSSSEQP
jgi:hypothetical protein